MLKTNVLIIGGGPAGATAARFLAESGIECVLVEKDFSYVKPCSGGIPFSALHEFGLPEHLAKKKVDRATVMSPMNCRSEMVLKDPYTGISRSVLNSVLRTMAKERGAALIEGRFIGFEENDGNRISQVEKKDGSGKIKIQSEYIFACDGVNFDVGRSCGCKTMPYHYTISAEIRPFHAETWEIWYGSAHAPRSYSWVYPLDYSLDNSVMIGTAGGHPSELPSMLDTFVRRRFNSTAKSLRDKNILGQTRIFPMPLWSNNNLRSGNIFFLGDAAGMVIPVRYEGIYFAMKSGQFAAQAVIQKKPELYQSLWDENFQENFTKMRKINDHYFENDQMIEGWITRAFALLGD